MDKGVPQNDLNKQNLHFRKIILVRIRTSGVWIREAAAVIQKGLELEQWLAGKRNME